MKGIHLAPDEFDFALWSSHVQSSGRSEPSMGQDHGERRVGHPTE